MSTTTPTPENAPPSAFELPRAEFGEPVKAASESPQAVGVSLPDDKRARRARPWVGVAFALPVALALLALLAAGAHVSRRHRSAPLSGKVSVASRSGPDRTRALGHRARHARHATRWPIRAIVAPVAHASGAQPVPAVAPPASTTESVPVAPAAATEPTQQPTSGPSSGEEQSGGGPFSP